ncbi:hypothetical protein AB0M39_03895 [Streptomyces sp. NPDC051907]|uniref:hypothetical protein n=1 Tax=Streptomyces sp. NPDC051907 TaxID=3155284 RepID=UPI003424DBC1
MTKARLFDPTRSGVTAEDLPVARAVAVGRYTFTPAAAYSSPDARGTLHVDGARVELRVTESLLSDFLTLLDAAQEELSRRWSDQGRSGFHAART